MGGARSYSTQSAHDVVLEELGFEVEEVKEGEPTEVEKSILHAETEVDLSLVDVSNLIQKKVSFFTLLTLAVGHRLHTS